MGQQVSGTVNRTGGTRHGFMGGAGRVTRISSTNHQQQYSTVIAPTAGGETTKIKFADDTPIISPIRYSMSLSAPWRIIGM